MAQELLDTLQAATAVVDSVAQVAEAAAPMVKPEEVANVLLTSNNIWMMLATGLVFIMHLGFATVETGLTRSKNTVNILFKNTITPAIGLITYAICGFNLMYPGFAEGSSGIFSFAGWGLPLPENGLTTGYASGGYTYWTDFLFQGMFAATCATIVSGAVAERIKLESYIIFTLLFVGLAYPIIGSWKWGKGFLDMRETPFYDFAGSTLVHSVGGWGALAGVMLLGPRIGKFVNGKVGAIPGHSMPLAVIGVFLLWLGWFGFNGGSVLSADPGLTSLVLVTTSLAAAAGALAAAITAFMIFKKHDLSMVLNGILGGLVAITAGADKMSPFEAIIIGLIGGVLVVFGVLMFDKIKLDDPVGALSVHLLNGIFGTLAVGMFGELKGMDQFVSQLVGVVACGAAAFTFAFIIFFILKKTMGIRVSAEEETEGLDIHEHGMSAYPDFNGK